MNTVPTTNELRTQAEAFARALNVGAVVVDDVVEWSNDVIEREDHPHWTLCELATCRREYPPDVAHRLREIPGVADLAASRVLVLQMLSESLKRDPRCATQVAHTLSMLADADEIADFELNVLAGWAWDALDRADAGISRETRADIVDKMHKALEAVASSGVTPG
jgi:hypothetical protein